MYTGEDEVPVVALFRDDAGRGRISRGLDDGGRLAAEAGHEREQSE